MSYKKGILQVKIKSKHMKELIDMGIAIIKHPGTNCIEIWINNVFICQGENIYINHYIEDEAYITTYYPEDEVEKINKLTEKKDPFFTEAEELPFN